MVINSRVLYWYKYLINLESGQFLVRKNWLWLEKAVVTRKKGFFGSKKVVVVWKKWSCLEKVVSC